MTDRPIDLGFLSLPAETQAAIEAEAAKAQQARAASDTDSEAQPVTVSVVIQMAPLWRVDLPGQPYVGDLKPYVESLTRYLVRNLQRFTEPRGGDLFVTVIAQRDSDSAGHEYRSGHYVKADAPAEASAGGEPS